MTDAWFANGSNGKVISKNRKIFCCYSGQFFNQVRGGVSPSGVRSDYTFIAVVMFFKDRELGDYPPVASAYFTDSETGSSNK